MKWQQICISIESDRNHSEMNSCYLDIIIVELMILASNDWQEKSKYFHIIEFGIQHQVSLHEIACIAINNGNQMQIKKAAKSD